MAGAATCQWEAERAAGARDATWMPRAHEAATLQPGPLALGNSSTSSSPGRSLPGSHRHLGHPKHTNSYQKVAWHVSIAMTWVSHSVGMVLIWCIAAEGAQLHLHASLYQPSCFPGSGATYTSDGA